MGIIKKIKGLIVKDKNITKEVKPEFKQYTKEELENELFEINDVYRVRLTRKVNVKDSQETKKETLTILAIRVGDKHYMDIETGKYYEVNRDKDNANKLNVYTAEEMPFRYYCCEALMEKQIEWHIKLNPSEFRDIIRYQKENYGHPMYENWGFK